MAESRHVGAGRLWTFSVSSILAASFGSLILVSVLAVLGLTALGAVRNTIELMRESGELVIGVIAGEIDSHLKAARDQTGMAAARLPPRRHESAPPRSGRPFQGAAGCTLTARNRGGAQ